MESTGVYNITHTLIAILQCGDMTSAVVTVPGVGRVFAPPPRFSSDGLTEKVGDGQQEPVILCLTIQLHLFHCEKEEELRSCLKKHISFVS